MKSILWLIMISFLAQLANAQTKGKAASASSNYFEQARKNTVTAKGVKSMVLEDYVIELFPGETFNGWYYYWAIGSASSCTLVEDPEVGWLSVDPPNFTSLGCQNIIPVRYSFQAPLAEGVYKTVMGDATGTWDSIRVELRVTRSPQNHIRKRFGINQDYLSYKSYLRNSPFNWSDNSCVKDYWPADLIKFDFYEDPDVGWVDISPSSGNTYRNDKQIFQNTLQKRLHDSIWVTLERNYHSFPVYYHYIVKQTEPKEYLLKFNGQNFISTGYYPGSSTRTMMYWVRFDGIKNQAVGVHDGANHRFYLGIQQDNSLFAGMGDSYNPLTSLNLIPGKWYNMAMTANNDSAVVYINATEVSRWKYSFSGESKSSFYIAARNDAANYGYFIAGLIDEFQVWERPLSRNEIIKYMFTPPSGDESGLVISYTFNEGWGDFTKNSVDNEYYGYLNKDPVWIDSIKRPTDPSIIITSVEDNYLYNEKALMLSSHPNPSDINTDITYNLPGPGHVLLQLFDIRGSLIRTVKKAFQPSGSHTFRLSYETMPAGTYIVKLIYTHSGRIYSQSIKIIRSNSNSLR